MDLKTLKQGLQGTEKKAYGRLLKSELMSSALDIVVEIDPARPFLRFLK